MDFTKHLFISYAHLDNEPMTPEQKGWITRFHTSLAAFVGMRLGKKAEIWRDDKLQGNDIFASEIVDQFPQTALLVSVVTPRYLLSEWCTKEVGAFCLAAEKNGGLLVDNKARIIKVIKTPVDNEASLPAAMKEALGYPFYIFNEEHAPLELDPAFGDDLAQAYNRKLATLAYQISELLKKLEGAGKSVPAVANGSPTAQLTVYLAECSYDRRAAREALETELKLHGYAVLPDRKLPAEEEEYVSDVGAMLARSQLSIHLVGARYGAVPDGPSEKSEVAIQNELAAKLSQQAGLRRVIWLPEGTTSQQPQQQALIESFLRDASMQLGADLVAGDLESLKGAIHAALKKLQAAKDEAAKPVPPPAPAGEKTVFVVCAEADRKSVIPLFKHLKSRGLEVTLPAFTGDAGEIRRVNEECVASCDALLFFYGAGDEAWKRHQENELKKLQASRGGRHLLASSIYVAEPITPDKEFLIEVGDAELINGLQGFPAAAVDEFVKVVSPQP